MAAVTMYQVIAIACSICGRFNKLRTSVGFGETQPFLIQVIMSMIKILKTQNNYT